MPITLPSEKPKRKISLISIGLGVILLVLLGLTSYQFLSVSFINLHLPVGGPPANYVKGGVIVVVKANSYEEASAVIEKYTKSYYELVTNNGDNYKIGVDVPVGQEQTWIEKFLKDPAVLDARYQLPTD